MKGLMTLPRSLAFAALAGIAAPLFVALLRPIVGSANALSIYAVSISAVYVFGLADRSGQALGAAFGLVLPAVALWIYGGAPADVAVLCAVLMGVLRSGWLRPDRRPEARFARAFAIEVVLIGVGLGLGAWAGQGAWSPIAMGVWSFFLVQSAFCLIGGPVAFEARTAPPTEVDPFEAATRRARSLLEEDVLS